MLFGFWLRLRDQRSLGADATVTAATNVAMAAISFCTGIAAARMLGPLGRGELAAIQTTPSVIATFAMIGMPEALVYFSAREPGQSGRYLKTGIVLALVASVPFMLVAWLSMPFLIHAQSVKVISDARWYLMIAPIWAIVAMMYHPLRGIGDFLSWNVLRLAVPIAAVAVLVVAYLTSHMTPTFVAFGTLLSYALFFLPCGFVVGRRLTGPFQLDCSKITLMLRYGLPCLMTGLPQILNLRVDQMLMAAFMPPRDLGLYVIAVAWSGAVSPVLNSIGATLLPAVASIDDQGHATARMSEGVRMTAMLALVVCPGVAAAAPFAIPYLFGAQFQGSVLTAVILVPAAGILGLNFSLQESIRGLGYPYAVLRAELVGLIVTGILLAALLRPLGIIGAAIASLLGYSAVTISMLVAAKQVCNISIAGLIIPRAAEVRRGILRIAQLAGVSA